MTIRELEVWLSGRRVATLRCPRRGKVTCRYALEIRQQGQLNEPLLSCSLPVRSGNLDAWPFTTGLLPEGQHRRAMAELARVTTIDLLGMLDRFGRDVAGAVVISANDPPVRDPGVEPYTEGSLADAIRDLEHHPLGLYDDSELSVAGLQDKMLLVARPDGGWGRPRHGYPSTHILKVDDRFHNGLVRAEHACLSLARAAGLGAAGSQLLTVGDSDCIVVSRFDRDIDSDGTVVRVHQEDACQALGIDPDRWDRRGKYEAYGGPSFKQIAGLLNSWAQDSAAGLADLLDHLVFTVAIGNADAHGKNIAFLHPQRGQIRLAPLYDTVPTTMWAQLRTTAAMTVAGKQSLPTLTIDDIVEEARSWSMNEQTARRRALDVAERLRDAVRSELVQVDTPALAHIGQRLERLLSGVT